jgi:signal peptide peptidase SppA
MPLPSDHAADLIRAMKNGSLWLSEPGHLKSVIDSLKAGDAQAAIPSGKVAAAPMSRTGGKFSIAVIEMNGMMMKGASWFGASTQEVAGLLRAAAASSEVDGILLVIDSPGGYVAGTKELADEVKRIDKTKPVVAYIEDLGASAAYWVASQARLVVANEMAEVGSIGVYTVIWDISKMLEDAGVKVRVVSSGGLKGAFADGATVTDEMVNDLKARIDDVAKYFVAAVASGRKMTTKKAEELADGRVHLAAKAEGLGLVDAVVANRDEALNMVVKTIASQRTQKRAEDAIRRLDAATAETGAANGNQRAAEAK